jgi:hypothetical protein
MIDSLLSDDNIGDTMTVSGDLNGDGIPDVAIVNMDVDGDGVADISQVDLDLDGDGVADVSQVIVDSDGDGLANIVLTDLNGDSIVDIFASGDAAQAVWGDQDVDSVGLGAEADPYASLEGTYSDFSFPGYNSLCGSLGTSAEDLALWDPQDDPNSCAVAVTNSMFRSVGFDPGETAIADTFKSFGIYNPAFGTNHMVIDDAINIIAATQGIDVQAADFKGVSIEQLEGLLEKGIKPLIAVDGAELYSGGVDRLLNDIGLLPNAPHAVHLIGIEHGPDGDFAVLNDPDTGAGQRIPLDVFRDAAEDFGFSGVATSNHATMADLDLHHDALGGNGAMLGSASMAQSVRADVFGNLYRGNSIIPFSGPNAWPPSTGHV